MTIEEAHEYWCKRLERAEGYSDEHWDAEERHAHADYVDAMAHAITALAIYREHEEANQQKSNGDRIRQMTDEELADFLDGFLCDQVGACRAPDIDCDECCLKWLKQEVSEDAGTD